MYSRNIFIAAAGTSKVYTIVIDGKYVYRIANGEKIILPCDDNEHVLRWIPPRKLSLSSEKKMKIRKNGDHYFKIAPKSAFLGMSADSIEECNSHRELEGLYRRERLVGPLPDGAVLCDYNNSVAVVAYEDRIIIIEQYDKRTVLRYENLMSVKNLSILHSEYDTIFYSWDNPQHDFKKISMQLNPKIYDFINQKIKSIQGFHECIVETKGGLLENTFYAIIVYDEKMTMIQSDNTRHEIDYFSLFSVNLEAGLNCNQLVLYDWTNPWEVVAKYDGDLSRNILDYINEQIGTVRNAHLLNINNEYYIKLFKNAIYIQDKETETGTQIFYRDLKYVETSQNHLIFHMKEENETTNSFLLDLPDNVLNFINDQISKLNETGGVKIFTSPTNKELQLKFFNDNKKFCIQRPNATSPMYSYDEITNYEVKEFDNSDSLMSTALLTAGALSGGKGAMTGALYAQHNKQRLSRIEVWLTLRHNGETIVEQVDFAHPFSAFEKSSRSYNEYNSAIIKLTAFLDEIRNESSTKPEIEAETKSIPQIQSQPPKDGKDVIAELREWKKLLDEGIISEEEFNSKKKQLLEL